MTISPTEFSVDLQQLNGAIVSIQGSHDNIVSLSGQIDTLLGQVPSDWDSPSGQTFTALVPQVQTAMQGLQTLLQDMIDSMQTSYDNYSSTELTNTANLTPS
jgi:WXG100 family type VII secretion target